MFYLLGWLQKRFSKWTNDSYPFLKNSSADEAGKIIFRSVSHHFIPNNKFSKNLKLTSYNSKSTFKDLNSICRILEFKTDEMQYIFCRMKKKIKESNYYKPANQLCSYGR